MGHAGGPEDNAWRAYISDASEDDLQVMMHGGEADEHLEILNSMRLCRMISGLPIKLDNEHEMIVQADPRVVAAIAAWGRRDEEGAFKRNVVRRVRVLVLREWQRQLLLEARATSADPGLQAAGQDGDTMLDQLRQRRAELEAKGQSHEQSIGKWNDIVSPTLAPALQRDDTQADGSAHEQVAAMGDAVPERKRAAKSGTRRKRTSRPRAGRQRATIPDPEQQSEGMWTTDRDQERATSPRIRLQSARRPEAELQSKGMDGFEQGSAMALDFTPDFGQGSAKALDFTPDFGQGSAKALEQERATPAPPGQQNGGSSQNQQGPCVDDPQHTKSARWYNAKDNTGRVIGKRCRPCHRRVMDAGKVCYDDPGHTVSGMWYIVRDPATGMEIGHRCHSCYDRTRAGPPRPPQLGLSCHDDPSHTHSVQWINVKDEVTGKAIGQRCRSCYMKKRGPAQSVSGWKHYEPQRQS